MWENGGKFAPLRYKGERGGKSSFGISRVQHFWAHTRMCVCVTVGESEENGKGRVVVVGGPAEVIQFLALPFLPYCSS